jgi:hypothetical protein
VHLVGITFQITEPLHGRHTQKELVAKTCFLQTLATDLQWINSTLAIATLRVFDNRVLKKLFGPKRDEVTGEWRKLHNEELNDLYSSPNTFRVIKPRRMRWVNHVSNLRERRGVYRVLVGKRTTWKTQL